MVERGEKKPRLMGSKHYDKDGEPYKPNFIDGYVMEDYPSEEEDLQWVEEGGVA